MRPNRVAFHPMRTQSIELNCPARDTLKSPIRWQARMNLRIRRPQQPTQGIQTTRKKKQQIVTVETGNFFFSSTLLPYCTRRNHMQMIWSAQELCSIAWWQWRLWGGQIWKTVTKWTVKDKLTQIKRINTHCFAQIECILCYELKFNCRMAHIRSHLLESIS